MKKLFLLLMIFVASMVTAQENFSYKYATGEDANIPINAPSYRPIAWSTGKGLKIDQIGNSLKFTQDPPFTLTKEQILQLAETSPAAKDFLKIQFPDLLKEVVDLSTTRTNGLHALAIGGGFGKILLVQLNTSPLQLYPNKSLLVGQSFTAEIVQSGNDQLIVFKQKN